MLSELSLENIDYLEEFISTKEPEPINKVPAISECYRDNIKKFWEIINLPETKPTSYFIVATNAMGMYSYGLYKTRENKIFLINTYIQNVISYYSIDNSWNMLKSFEELLASYKYN